MKTLITLLIILFSFNLQANDHLKYASFNIGINSLIGGFGSALHKKENETFFDAFKHGFWKGALGGSLNYYGMRLVEVSASKDNLNYIWPGRIVNALGSSITYNAAANDKIWSSFNMNVFCFNVQYNGKVNLRVDPLSLGYATYLGFKKDMSFNFKNTILTGSILFEQKSDNIILDGIDYGHYGTSVGNSLYYKPAKEYFYDHYTYNETINGNIYSFPSIVRSIKNITNYTICHEIVHTFQYEQFSSLNLLYIDKAYKAFKIKVNKYLYINPNFGIIYLLNNIKGYDNNIFENEADFFGKSDYFTTNVNYHY